MMLPRSGFSASFSLSEPHVMSWRVKDLAFGEEKTLKRRLGGFLSTRMTVCAALAVRFHS